MCDRNICPYFEKTHKVQCKAPAFSPLIPGGCEGSPFHLGCTVPPLSWRIMVTGAGLMPEVAAKVRANSIKAMETSCNGDTTIYHHPEIETAQAVLAETELDMLHKLTR